MDDHKQELRETKVKKTRVLVIILLLSVVIVAGYYVLQNFFPSSQSDTEVDHNIITEKEDIVDEEDGLFDENKDEQNDLLNSNNLENSLNQFEDEDVEKVLELYQKHPNDNYKYEVMNMFPGDVETKDFVLKVSHKKDTEILFKTKVTKETKELSNVLHIKVTHLDTGKVLLDEVISQADNKVTSIVLKSNSHQESVVHYRIDVSLDTSVGNEYQNATLEADFEWYVLNEENLKTPVTNDNNNVLLWCVTGGLSLIVLIVLWKRRNGDEQYE